MPGSNQFNKLSFFSCNISGLFSKTLGDKLQTSDFLSMIKNFDFIILSETWKKGNIDVEGFKVMTTNAVKTGKCGRHSGDLALLYNSKLRDWIQWRNNRQIFYGLKF